MHLENELRALRPQVGRPSSATVAGHRRALDAAIAEGRTAPRWSRGGPDGRPRWLAAVAAVLVVVVAGGAVWWAITRTDDVRLDTGAAGSPVTGPGTVAAVTAGDQSTSTVTTTPESALACGPDTPAGDVLPGFLQILPNEADVTSDPSTFDVDGRLVTRRENERFAVEAVWPAPDRQLYASDGQVDGLGRADDEISYTVSREGQTELIVVTSAEITALRVVGTLGVAVTDPCRYVQFTVSERGNPIARFTYDLAAAGGYGEALVDRNPLVVETRQLAEAPAEAVPCNGGPGAPANDDTAVEGPVAATPAEALDAFLATPEASYYQSGYVEFVTPDGTYTYGAPIVPGGSDWVTLVTVSPVEGGWAATHVTASGC